MMESEPCGPECKGRIINKLKGVYCQHIESQMAKPSNQGIRAFFSDRIENQPELDTRNSCLNLEEKLEKFGLQAYEVDLIMARLVEGKKMSVVVQEQEWLSIGSASYHYAKALRKLREGKFRA